MQYFRARCLVPVDSPPIDNGMVAIEGNRIAYVGAYQTGTRCVDLGECAVIPGLVNAHTHWEFSDLSSPLAGRDKSFASWLEAVVEYRQAAADEPSESGQTATERGWAESARTGTVLAGEIATGDWPAHGPDLALRAVIFRELLGSRPEQLDANLATARQHVQRGRSTHAWQPGLSPHAPYSTSVELVEHVAQLSASTGAPVAMHLAESVEELELLSSHSGPLLRFLDDMGAWNPAAIPRGIAAMDYLRILQGAHRTLVVHGNYLKVHEMDFLASHRDSMSVIYCPRTHAYFEHGPYPLAEMLSRGVRIAIGTDSKASNPDLSLLDELRYIARLHGDVTPREILSLGTLEGARALGYDRQLGSVAPGKFASLLAIPLLPMAAGEDVYEQVLASAEPPRWIVPV